MSGRLSRKRRTPPSPDAGLPSLDITDDFSDQPVTFRAPKKPRLDPRNHCNKDSTAESSLRKSSRCHGSSKSIPATKTDVKDKKNVQTGKNSSTKNTGKRKEIVVLTLDDDDDKEEEKQGDESDDSESPFLALHSPEKARNILSSPVKSRKSAEAGDQTLCKRSSPGRVSAATTSNYFSAAAAAPKLNLINRRPSKFRRGAAQNSTSTAFSKNKSVCSNDPHKNKFTNEPEPCNTLSIVDDDGVIKASNSASDTLAQSYGVGSAAGSVTVADSEKLPTKSVNSQEKLTSADDNKAMCDGVDSGGETASLANAQKLATKSINTKKKLIGGSETVQEQVRVSDDSDDDDDTPNLLSNADQRQLIATVSDDDDDKEEEFNLDTVPIDPFLTEMEKSVCSEHEKLCPSCKCIVPVSQYGSHLRLCFGKYQYSKQGDEVVSESRRRGRSAAVNNIQKEAVVRNDRVEDANCQTLTSENVVDDFKRPENKSKCHRTSGKSSRDGRTKSRHFVEDRAEVQKPHKESEMEQSAELKTSQEKLLVDRIPSSADGGVVKNRQPLLSIAAGTLQVVQKEESTTAVLDPAAALTTEVSCMVRIKRSRGQGSSRSSAPAPAPGALKTRRGRGKKTLLVMPAVSAEQRSEALAQRLAAVLLSGKPNEDEPWETVTRGRTTAVGTRLSSAVSRVISTDQPLWQLCRSNRGDIQQYYVPELAPHLVPPAQGNDSLNITMHRHLSQIPGRLNITQSLGVPADIFTDDEEEESYGLQDRSTSAPYGHLNTTQLALARLLGSQVDEILNWSLRSTANTSGERRSLGSYVQEERQHSEGPNSVLQPENYAQKGKNSESNENSKVGVDLDCNDELNEEDGKDAEEGDLLHHRNCSGIELEGAGINRITNRREDKSGLCNQFAESRNDISSPVKDNFSCKSTVSKMKSNVKISSDECPIPGDSETDPMKTIANTENLCDNHRSDQSTTSIKGGNGQGISPRKNNQSDRKNKKDSETDPILSVDASAVICESVLQIALKQHSSNYVECIKTTQMDIPAIEPVDALQLNLTTDSIQSNEIVTKPMVPSVLTDPGISSSTNSKEIHTTVLDNRTVSKGSSSCSREGDAEDVCGGPGDRILQDEDSTESLQCCDDAASDLTILFDTSADAEVTSRQEKTDGSGTIDSRRTLQTNNDGKETPEKTTSNVDGAKENSPTNTIVFDMHEVGSNADNLSDDNRQPVSTSIQDHDDIKSKRLRLSPDIILLDGGSSSKSLSIEENNSTIRANMHHVQQQSRSSSSTAMNTSSANRANKHFHTAVRTGHETKSDIDGAVDQQREETKEQSELCQTVPRHCTTIPASDCSVSDDNTDQMFSKTKNTDIKKRISCSKRTLSNLSIKNLSIFNSLQAASPSNANPASQSSDYMLERYLTTLVRDVSTPAVPASLSGEDAVQDRSLGVEAAAENLTSHQNTMMGNMTAAWRELLMSEDGGDVTVYTRTRSFFVHAFVLRVRCSSLVKEALGNARNESNIGEMNDGEGSSKLPCLLWQSHSREASVHFFSYIYAGYCDLKGDEPAVVSEVLSLARKYEREDLVQYCQSTSVYNLSHHTGSSHVQSHEGKSGKKFHANDEFQQASSSTHHTTPMKVTSIPADKVNYSAERTNNPHKSLSFPPSSPADHDSSLPSLGEYTKNGQSPSTKSKIRPVLSTELQTTCVSSAKGTHFDVVCHSTTLDKLPEALHKTPIDISKLLEGKLCGMSSSVSNTARTTMSPDKLRKHYKSSATVRSMSPDLFSDGDEDSGDQSEHPEERICDHSNQSLISKAKDLHNSDHSAPLKILPDVSNHSVKSNTCKPDSDVRLRLSSVDKTNSTVRDYAGNDNSKRRKDSVEQNEASNLDHLRLESDQNSSTMTDDQITSSNINKFNSISTSEVKGEDNVIDISQSDSEVSSQSSTPTLPSVHQHPNSSLPHSLSKVNKNKSCGKATTEGCSRTAELYNKTTDAESEMGQTCSAYVSNVWDDFEDMACYQDIGEPFESEPAMKKPPCNNENNLTRTGSLKTSNQMEPHTKISDDRPNLSEPNKYELNSTVVEAAKNKILNLSSACQNISRISLGEATDRRRSQCLGGVVTSCEPALDSYTLAKTGQSSVTGRSDTGDLHSNTLVRKMFSNDTLLQLQDELQKEWDGDELEMSTGVNDTSLRSRLTNKRKREQELCRRESPKHKRKCRTPSKRTPNVRSSLSSSEAVCLGNEDLTKKTNSIRNVTKQQRVVSTINAPSVTDHLPDVEGSPVLGALPRRVQQLQGRRDSITSPNTAPLSPNCSAADSSLAITPKPDFSTMPTPDLKRRLQQFGIRPLSRNKARALLQHIYEQTHPVVTADKTSDARDSDRAQSPAGGLRTSTPVGRSRAGTARRNARTQNKTPLRTVTTVKSVESVTSRAESRKQMLKASDCEERLKAHEALTTDISSIKTAELVDLSQSDGEENSASGCVEESLLLDLPDEQRTAASTAEVESVHEQLRALIVSDSTLHRAVLLYQPLWLHHLKDAVANAGIRCTAAALVDFLDQQCITFRMGSSAGPGRTRQKKARKKRGVLV